MDLYISKELLVDWSHTTWSDAWNIGRNLADLRLVANEDKLKGYLSRLRKRNDFQAFSQRPITGSISEGWKDLNASGPLFQNSLWTVMERWPDNWTPLEYLFEYCIDCKAHIPKSTRHDLGRALRNLPSFLREYFINAGLLKLGQVSEIPSPEQNAKRHADLYVTTSTGRVAVWSFQSTTKSKEMLLEKIRSRSKSFGEHNLFAPFRAKSDAKSIANWHVPSDQYISDLVLALDQPKEQSSQEFKVWLDVENRQSTSRFSFVLGSELEKLRGRS